MNKQENEYDVIIVGGGVNGLMMASLLSSGGNAAFKIALIESSAITTDESEQNDARLLAITPATRKLLEHTAVWQTISSDRLGHFKGMKVWQACDDSCIEFDPQELSEACLAYTIENRVLQSRLFSSLCHKPELDVYQSTKIEDIQYQQNSATVILEDKRTLQSDLLIAADGQRSFVRERAGISFVSESYGQTALACIIETEQAHEDIARQRFLDEGILAFLPMHQANQSAIVWSTESRRAEELKQMSRDEFHQALFVASHNMLGKIVKSQDRVAYPLIAGQAQKYCLHRLALIGDAAHSVHPLAGQGANLGFMDAAVLAEILYKARERGADIGYHSVLRKYERWRRGDNIMMMNVFSGFKWIYEQQQKPVPVLRTAGMKFLDQCGLLKQPIMNRAMGLSGDLPAILRR